MAWHITWQTGARASGDMSHHLGRCELALIVDGQERVRGAARPPDVLAETLSVGAAPPVGRQADATLDEFRLSDTTVGNSNACATSWWPTAATTASKPSTLGRFISTYGTSGSGPGQFRDPQGLAVDDRPGDRG